MSNSDHGWRRPNRAFGPVIEEKDGNLRAMCQSGRTYCTFGVGGSCTHVKPAREIEGFPDTPEWCEMRERHLQDAAAMMAKQVKREAKK